MAFSNVRNVITHLPGNQQYPACVSAKLRHLQEQKVLDSPPSDPPSPTGLDNHHIENIAAAESRTLGRLLASLANGLYRFASWVIETVNPWHSATFDPHSTFKSFGLNSKDHNEQQSLKAARQRVEDIINALSESESSPANLVLAAYLRQGLPHIAKDLMKKGYAEADVFAKLTCLHFSEMTPDQHEALRTGLDNLGKRPGHNDETARDVHDLYTEHLEHTARKQLEGPMRDALAHTSRLIDDATNHDRKTETLIQDGFKNFDIAANQWLDHFGFKTSGNLTKKDLRLALFKLLFAHHYHLTHRSSQEASTMLSWLPNHYLKDLSHAQYAWITTNQPRGINIASQEAAATRTRRLQHTLQQQANHFFKLCKVRDNTVYIRCLSQVANTLKTLYDLNGSLAIYTNDVISIAAATLSHALKTAVRAGDLTRLLLALDSLEGVLPQAYTATHRPLPRETDAAYARQVNTVRADIIRRAGERMDPDTRQKLASMLHSDPAQRLILALHNAAASLMEDNARAQPDSAGLGRKFFNRSVDLDLLITTAQNWQTQSPFFQPAPVPVPDREQSVQHVLDKWVRHHLSLFAPEQRAALFQRLQALYCAPSITLAPTIDLILQPALMQSLLDAAQAQLQNPINYAIAEAGKLAKHDPRPESLLDVRQQDDAMAQKTRTHDLLSHAKAITRQLMERHGFGDLDKAQKTQLGYAVLKWIIGQHADSEQGARSAMIDMFNHLPITDLEALLKADTTVLGHAVQPDLDAAIASALYLYAGKIKQAEQYYLDWLPKTRAHHAKLQTHNASTRTLRAYHDAFVHLRKQANTVLTRMRDLKAVLHRSRRDMIHSSATALTPAFASIVEAAQKHDFIDLIRQFDQLEPILPRADIALQADTRLDTDIDHASTFMGMRRDILQKTLENLALDDAVLQKLGDALNSRTMRQLLQQMPQASAQLLPAGPQASLGLDDLGRALANRNADLKQLRDIVIRMMAQRGLRLSPLHHMPPSNDTIFHIMRQSMDIPHNVLKDLEISQHVALILEALSASPAHPADPQLATALIRDLSRVAASKPPIGAKTADVLDQRVSSYAMNPTQLAALFNGLEQLLQLPAFASDPVINTHIRPPLMQPLISAVMLSLQEIFTDILPVAEPRIRHVRQSIAIRDFIENAKTITYQRINDLGFDALSDHQKTKLCYTLIRMAIAIHIKPRLGHDPIITRILALLPLEDFIALRDADPALIGMPPHLALDALTDLASIVRKDRGRHEPDQTQDQAISVQSQPAPAQDQAASAQSQPTSPLTRKRRRTRAATEPHLNKRSPVTPRHAQEQRFATPEETQKKLAEVLKLSLLAIQNNDAIGLLHALEKSAHTLPSANTNQGERIRRDAALQALTDLQLDRNALQRLAKNLNGRTSRTLSAWLKQATARLPDGASARQATTDQMQTLLDCAAELKRLRSSVATMMQQRRIIMPAKNPADAPADIMTDIFQQSLGLQLGMRGNMVYVKARPTPAH